MSYRRRSLAKLKGEWAELQFMSRALALGLRVARVSGDHCPYDFLVDAAGRLSRVQVKSVWRKKRSTYGIPAQHDIRDGKTPYRAREVDFVVGYVVPEDSWYVVPAREFAGRRNLCVYPHKPGSRGRFEKYRDAWHLLGPLPARFDLSAEAERVFLDPEQDSKTDGIRELLVLASP